MSEKVGMFGEKFDWEPPKESCLTCRYYGFVGLKRWCLHPENDRQVNKPKKKCKLWIDRFSKEEGPEKLKKSQPHGCGDGSERNGI